ncbi:MAG TPA: hypothetical protein VK711_03640 [Puia sp.]|nr:hypothetical protein [Puia sp.]
MIANLPVLPGTSVAIALPFSNSMPLAAKISTCTPVTRKSSL